MFRWQQATLLLVGVLLLSAPVTAAQDLQTKNEVLVPLRGERVSESKANGPPQNLTAYALSDTELKVTWFAPDEPPIYYNVSVTNPYMDEVTYDTFYILTGLEECRDYTITVSSEYDASGTNSFPDKTIGTTSSAEPPPPKNCEITDITSNYMQLTWDKPDTLCPVTNYSVSWINIVLWSGEQGYGSGTTTGLRYHISDLIPWTNYTYNIAAATEAGFGEPLTCSAVTLEDVPGPVIITKVIVNAQSATIYWLPPDPVNGNTQKYEVTLKHKGSDITKQFDGQELQGTFDDLAPCENYTVDIRARNDLTLGWGPLTSDNNPFILYDDAPAESADCSMDKWTVNMCWEPAARDCPVSQYVLDWNYNVLWSDESGSGNIKIPGDTNDFCESWDNLTPYANYSVCVNVGQDSSGPCCSTQTSPDRPSAPYLEELKADGVDLITSWTEPEVKNGILNGYRLTWIYSEGVVDQLTLDSSTFSQTIKGLTRCLTYTIKVEAETVGAVGWGEESNNRSATITNSITDEGLVCNGTESRAASVSWSLEADDCPVSEFLLTWHTTVLWSGYEDSGTAALPGNVTDFTLTSLPYTSFEFCISIQGSLEPDVCCTDTTEEEAPSAPYLEELQRDEENLIASWTEPEEINGLLDSYHLTWTDTMGTIHSLTFDNSTLCHTLPVQGHCGEYKVLVQAKTIGGGWGELSNMRSKIIGDNRVTEITCDGSESREASASWSVESEDCLVTHFILTWHTTALWSNTNSRASDMISVSGNETSFTLTDLLPYTEFEFCIKIANTSSASAVCCSSTTKDEAPGPVRVMGVSVYTDSVNITWLPPISANGIIREYEVTLNYDSGPVTQQVDGETFEATISGLVSCENYTIDSRARTLTDWGPLTSYMMFMLLGCDTA